MAAAHAGFEELERAREFLCRLSPDRALESPDEAEEFLHERGMLTLMPDCSLPSLFGACHEGPYKPGGRGFASWPRTKWWWGGELAARPGAYSVRLHAGKTLYLTEETAALADPLCRQELAAVDEGRYGRVAQRIARHLADAGPAAIDELKEELGLGAKDLRKERSRLERVGAFVSRDLRVVTAKGSHRHTSELFRWDQLFPEASGHRGGLEELVAAGVRAAVLTPEREVRSWFSWRVSSATLDALVDAGRIERPAPGFLSAEETPFGRGRAIPSL